jgi:virulence factor Mce-like protein
MSSQRLTPRRRTRRRDVESPWRTSVKGLIVLAVIGFFVYVGVSSYNGVPFRHYRSLTVEVSDTGNLIEHDPVRIAGVQVGQVTGESATRGGRARVSLQIDPGTRIPQGTQVMIRTNGLLGARYVQLIPSTSRRLLPSGALIVGTAGTLTDGVPEALDALDAKTRSALGSMLNGLGAGVLGQGESLHAAIGDAAPAAESFTELAQSILAPPGAAARLLPALDSTMAPLDAARGPIAVLLAPASRALAPLVSERPQVRASITAAPSALSTAAGGLNTGDALLASATALADAARETLPLLPAGLRQATTLLRTSPVPLQRGDALLRELRPTIPATLEVTRALDPVLAPLRQGLVNLQPMLVYTGQRGCDIENFGVTLRSMTGYGGVGSGPIGSPMEFRAQMVAGPDVLQGFGSPPHGAYGAPCATVDNPASLPTGALR